MFSANAMGVRALLTKGDAPSIQLMLWRNSASDFEMIENGRAVGVFYRTIVPPHFDNYFPLEEAWQKLIELRYPGYQLSNVEEALNEA